MDEWIESELNIRNISLKVGLIITPFLDDETEGQGGMLAFLFLVNLPPISQNRRGQRAGPQPGLSGFQSPAVWAASTRSKQVNSVTDLVESALLFMLSVHKNVV